MNCVPTGGFRIEEIESLFSILQRDDKARRETDVDDTRVAYFVDAVPERFDGRDGKFSPFSHFRSFSRSPRDAISNALFIERSF